MIAMAFVEGAVEQQIRAGAIGAPLVVKGRPFPKDSGRAEIDVGVRTSRVRVVVCHLSFAFSASIDISLFRRDIRSDS